MIIQNDLVNLDYQKFYPKPVVGLDEAGRGSLAGPVFASAVILNFPQEFRDSKQLNPKQRRFYSAEIKKNHTFSIGTASVKEIEKLNIHQASLLAMKRAFDRLHLSTAHLLIDGKFPIPSLSDWPQTPVVKGDRRVSPISAAGILAKTERDSLFLTYAKKYPGYGFETHKGYATKKHKSAIEKQGPCPLHRKSFSGVKEYL